MRYTGLWLIYAALWAALTLALWPFNEYGFAAEHAQQARILVLTDLHGRLEERGGDVGLPKLLSAVKEWREKSPESLLVSVGDLFTGSVESDLLHGKPVLEGMKEAGLALSAVGNHEFDWKSDNVAAWSRAGLPFVCANVRDARGLPPEGVRPYVLREVGGIKVAFVGLITEDAALGTVREHTQDLQFLPPLPALESAAWTAWGEGAEAVVVLAHLSEPARQTWVDGIDPQIRALARVPFVTAVVYGHSHEEHQGAERGTEQVVEKGKAAVASVEAPVPVVQPAPYGRALAVLTLQKDAQGKVRATATLDKLWQRKAGLPEDPAGKEVTRKARADLGPALDRVVARTERALTYDEHAPSLLGEVVCDAMRAQTGAEVALTNGGGIRGALEQGDITERDLFRVLPFNNYMVLMTLSGADLRAVLEYSLNNTRLRCVQMSGLKAVYDGSRPLNTRIVSLTRTDGSEVGAEDELRVAVNSFIARGGDGFPLPHLGGKPLMLEVEERDVLRRYLQRAGTLRPQSQGWLTVRHKPSEAVGKPGP